LRRLRETSELPVIFLTSKDEEQDEEAGLAMGADDYIAKPFSQPLPPARIRAIPRRAGPVPEPEPDDGPAPPDAGALLDRGRPAVGADDYIAKPFTGRLLLARSRAILRRSGRVREPEPGDEPAAPDDGALLVRGRLAMDPARHRVTWAGRPVSLTVTEFLILEALAQRPGVIKSRNQLMDAAYPDDVFVDDRTVDSHIKRLRRKFRAADPEFGAIETLYGAGY